MDRPILELRMTDYSTLVSSCINVSTLGSFSVSIADLDQPKWQPHKVSQINVPKTFYFSF
jgi:hypothetical protein